MTADSLAGTVIRKVAASKLAEIRAAKVPALERELAGLRQRNARLEQERDVLQDELRSALVRVSELEDRPREAGKEST